MTTTPKEQTALADLLSDASDYIEAQASLLAAHRTGRAPEKALDTLHRLRTVPNRLADVERGYTIVASDRLAALEEVERAAFALDREHRLYGIWRLPDRFRDIRAALSRSEAAEKGARG